MGELPPRVLRRALIRLSKLIRGRTSAPIPVLIIEDPAMGKLDPEVFHEIFWRATRSVVYSLASIKSFKWYLAPGISEGHIQYIARLRSRVAQVGEAVPLEYIRSNLNGSVLLGHVPVKTLRDGNPVQVRDIAASCAEKARALGLPLFLSPSGAVELGTPLENIAAFVNAQ
jgi:uroporphyrinogen-III decarboxylase